MNQIEQGYPRVMVHPGYAAAVNSTELYKGSPVRWPPVTVYKNDDEQKERARGYLMMGEPLPERHEFTEYPMMLHHPDHVEPIPEEKTAIRENGQLIISVIPGRPEEYPAVIVNNAAEKEAQEAKGYKARAQDPQAYLNARAVPKVKPEEFVLNEYPKYLRQFDKTVQNRDEENAVLGMTVAAPQGTPLTGPTASDELLAQLAALRAENAELKRKRGGRPKKMKLKPPQEQPAAE